MKSFHALLFLFFVSYLASAQVSSERNSHILYYDILYNGNVEQLESLINNLTSYSPKDTLALSGALKMKLAGKLGSPFQKLSSFKDGRKALDSAIENDSLNAEYRFLRIIIQENAPGILGYNDKMEEDKNLILKKFPKLNESLQSEIRKYTNSSKVLTLSSLRE